MARKPRNRQVAAVVLENYIIAVIAAGETTKAALVIAEAVYNSAAEVAESESRRALHAAAKAVGKLGVIDIGDRRGEHFVMKGADEDEGFRVIAETIKKALDVELERIGQSHTEAILGIQQKFEAAISGTTLKYHQNIYKTGA